MATAKPPKRQVAAKRKPSPAKPQQRQDVSAADALRLLLWNNEDVYRDVAESPYFRDTLGVNVPVQSRGELSSAMGGYSRKEKKIYVNPAITPYDSDTSQTPASVRTAKNVLTHEAGHALSDALPRGFPSYYAVKRPQMRTLVESGKLPYNEQEALGWVNVDSNEYPDRMSTEFDVAKNQVTERTPRWLGLSVKESTRPMRPSEQKALQALDRYYAFGERVPAFTSDPVFGTNPDEAFAQAYTNAAGFLSETAGDTTGFRERLGRYEGNTPGAGAIVRDLLRGRPIYKQHPLKGVIR